MKAKYSPTLTNEHMKQDFIFNSHGEPPAEYIKGVHEYNEETMFDNYDRQGFDRYGYSAFDNKGTFVGVGNGVDRDGYTEEDYEHEEEY